MRNALKAIVQGVMELTPFRIVRAPENRFDAIPEVLGNLLRMGYSPKVIVDGGAHLGSFAELANSVFPKASIHMIEPQPACQRQLAAFAAQRGFAVHPFALVSNEEVGKSIQIASDATPSTGAHVAPKGGAGTQTVETSTLDQLFGFVTPGDRTLIKLDLQGYELAALKGGIDLLAKAEVVISEVSLFRQAYEPTIAELVGFLDLQGFELFDIAAFWARRRDNRPKQGDFVFVKKDSKLATDTGWE